MNKFEVSNMDLYYGSFHALKNININIPEREITAISRAPARRAAAWAVRDAPPVPKTTTFFPASVMPARRAM